MLKNLRVEGHSLVDFVAVHLLAASVKNILKGQSQHFVQGCRETAKKNRDRRRQFITHRCAVITFKSIINCTGQM